MWKKENLFIEHYLNKSKLVMFWNNNWINSENYITIPYFDEFLEEKYFYPDFIIYFKNGDVWIFDSKVWFLSKESIQKARWLDKYIKEQSKKDKKYIWGIIESEIINWSNEVNFLINNKVEFNYNNKIDFTIFSDEYILRKLLDKKLK